MDGLTLLHVAKACEVSGLDVLTSLCVGAAAGSLSGAFLTASFPDDDGVDQAGSESRGQRHEAIGAVVSRVGNLHRDRGFGVAAMAGMNDQMFTRMFRLPRPLFDELLRKVCVSGFNVFIRTCPPSVMAFW